MKYTYKVLRLSVSGMATVEYISKELGSITRVFVVPYDRGEERVRRKVIEMFPTELFYSRYLTRSASLRLEKTEQYLVSGEMNVDFDDNFYDIMEMITHETKGS